MVWRRNGANPVYQLKYMRNRHPTLLHVSHSFKWNFGLLLYLLVRPIVPLCSHLMDVVKYSC